MDLVAQGGGQAGAGPGAAVTHASGNGQAQGKGNGQKGKGDGKCFVCGKTRSEHADGRFCVRTKEDAPNGGQGAAKSEGKGESKGKGKGLCFVCQKPRSEHPDGRYCPKPPEAVSTVQQEGAAAGAAPKSKAKAVAPKAAAKASGRAEEGMTIQEARDEEHEGCSVVYDELLEATASGLVSSCNILSELAGSEEADAVRASVREGSDTLASLFALASSRGHMLVENLDELDDDSIEVRERQPGR